MFSPSLSLLANHLWQSTLFACVAGLLTLALRKNPARVRHWIWVVASLKFLVPFSGLITLGGQIHWRTVAPPQIDFSIALDQVSQPFAAPVISGAPLSAASSPASPLPVILAAVWAIGFIGIAGAWWIRWRRITAAVRAGSPVQLDLPIRAISSPSFLEPGVFGIFRSVLMLPQGIFEHLTPEQTKSVLAHELCHVRHRDNLIGAVQMFIETVFWFHPLVWWIGKRIFEEREQACDEEVVKLGNEPRVYARGILKVCELYLESPMPCVAGVSGSNLRRRIEAIMHDRIVKKLNSGTKALLAAAGVFAVAAPIAIGLLHGVTLRAQTVSPELRFEVASVKAVQPDGRGLRDTGIPGPNNTDPGRFTAHTHMLDLVITAYEIPIYRLSETQDLYHQQVDVEAKMPVDTTRAQFNVMLQNLLADRFGLKVHWASKDIETYALTVAKGGPKFKFAAPDSTQTTDGNPDKIGSNGFPIPPPGNRPWIGAGPGGKMVIRGHNETIAEMATAIGRRTLPGPLMDATGLTGRYDYTVFWSMSAQSAALQGAPVNDEPDGPNIFDAFQDQLGLKIEKRKGPVQMLVVDHVEKKPTEN